MKYRDFIQDNFKIIDKRGKVVDFVFNEIQNKYYDDVVDRYGNNFQGTRDIILKARKEGISSLILALFATDFILSKDPIASVVIADTKPETTKLLKRARFYIESYLYKKEPSLRIEDLCDVVSKYELVNCVNGAIFWIGTAGARVAPRVESVQNLHFSEAAHFQDTNIIQASEIIEGAAQMVEQGTGRIFIESTARGVGNYFHKLWRQAERRLSEYRPVFFSASDFYSQEWLEKKRRSFTTEEMGRQEYPLSPMEAFIMSGDNFFDKQVLDYLYKRAEKRKPIYEGDLNIPSLQLR